MNDLTWLMISLQRCHLSVLYKYLMYSKAYGCPDLTWLPNSYIIMCLMWTISNIKTRRSVLSVNSGVSLICENVRIL